MMLVGPAQMWMVIVVILSQSSISLQCTFTNVAGSFNLSLIATYNDTTELECLSKCSVDVECTFLDYNEGLCRIFKAGTDVHELGFNSKAFAYSYEMMETTCRTEVVSKPRSLNLQTSTPKHAYPCSDGSENVLGEAITRKNLLEAPDDLARCWYGSYEYYTWIPLCTTASLYFYRKGKSLRHSLAPIDKSNVEFTRYVSSIYCSRAPFAVAEYKCRGTERYIAVIDTDGEPNAQFSDFADLEYIESTPVFYDDVSPLLHAISQKIEKN